MPIPTCLSVDHFDFKVCSLDFLYQEEFSIINNGSVSKSFQFSIEKDLSEIVKIHPVNGFVQAKNQTRIHIKLELNRDSLEKIENSKFFDSENDVIEAPVKVHLSDQRLPLELMIFAIVNRHSLKVCLKMYAQIVL